MAKQAREFEQEFLATLEATTGQTLSGWMDTIRESGETKTNAIIKWIKASYPLNHRQASMLAGIFLNDGKPFYDYEVMFARLFEGGKAAQQPLYDHLQQAIAGAVPQAEFIPTKTYISIEAERVFGLTLTNSAGRDIPVRWIGEQHVREDCQGRIPSLADWLRRIQPEPWMANGHIDRHVGDEPCGDPRVAWASDVAAGRTVLGLKEWMAARATQATQSA